MFSHLCTGLFSGLPKENMGRAILPISNVEEGMHVRETESGLACKVIFPMVI